MYIYLGNDLVIPENEIVGIFDIERVTTDRYMKELLNAWQKAGKIYYVTLDLPKSIVVSNDTAYICGVSVGTLKKRALRSEQVKLQ